MQCSQSTLMQGSQSTIILFGEKTSRSLSDICRCKRSYFFLFTYQGPQIFRKGFSNFSYLGIRNFEIRFGRSWKFFIKFQYGDRLY